MRLRHGITLALIGAAGTAACHLVLPERLAIRGPITNSIFGWGVGAPDARAVASRIRVPDGFGFSIFAEEIPNARMLRFTGSADLLVSAPRKGRITLLEPDRDGDGRSDGRRTLVEGLSSPHGMDLREGWLYVAEGDGVVRLRFDAKSARVRGEPEPVVRGLPSGGNHWMRTLRFGPDGWMYVTVGSSCNACIEDDPRRGAMLRFRPDGGGAEIFATGLRNSVDFDWRPADGELYATDNGRDLLGDDFPPCELNRIVRRGFYGWPFANGDRVPDPDHGEGHEAEIARSLPPVHGFKPHTAPLGMTFLRSDRWPPEYRGAAVVALHGSWNRTELIGYEVVTLHWTKDGIEERKLLSGLEMDGDVIGRPVGVAEGPDGAIYVSDDYAGVIYRIAYGEAKRVPKWVAPRPPKRAALDPSAVERGAALWSAGGCARCHDAKVAPEAVAVKRISRLSARYTLAGLAEYLAAPNPPMPPVERDEETRRDLAAYLLAEHP